MGGGGMGEHPERQLPHCFDWGATPSARPLPYIDMYYTVLAGVLDLVLWPTGTAGTCTQVTQWELK